MLQPSFRAYHVELGANLVCPPDHPQALLFPDVLLHHRWHRKYARPGFAEGSEERVVLELTLNRRPNSPCFKPEIEIPAQRSVFGGEEHGRTIERLRELAVKAVYGFRSSNKDHSALAELVAVRAYIQGGIDR